MLFRSRHRVRLTVGGLMAFIAICALIINRSRTIGEDQVMETATAFLEYHHPDLSRQVVYRAVFRRWSGDPNWIVFYLDRDSPHLGRDYELLHDRCTILVDRWGRCGLDIVGK